MISVLKVNLLTDDEQLPHDLKERLEGLLQEVIKDDPEGSEHAVVVLEYKSTVNTRAYMKGLAQTGERQVIKPANAPSPKRRRRS